MKCNEKSLSAYLDGELDDATQEAVADHIETCPACAETLGRLQGANEILPRHPLPHQFHLRLSRKIQAQAAQQRRRRVLILSAAAAALLITGALFFSRIMDDGPPIETPDPVAQSTETAPAIDDEPTRTSPIEQQEIAVEEEVAVEPTLTLASAETPPYVLRGTLLGALSQATILSNETGETETYGEGEEIAPGVLLVAIGKREVTLDIDGVRTPLRVSSSSGGYVSMTGNWQLITEVGPGYQEEGPVLSVTEDPDSLTMSLGEEAGLLDLRGSRQGSRFVVSTVRDTGSSIRIEGDLNAEVSVANAIGYQGDEQMEIPVILRRVTEEDLDARALREAQLEAQLEQVKYMGEVLVQYAKAHNGKYPNTLYELVPDFVPNLELFADTEDMGLTYNSGLAYLDVSKAMREAGYDASTRSDPDGLLNFEAALRNAWNSEIPVMGVLLRADFASTSAAFTVNVRGDARELAMPGSPINDPGLDPEMREALINAQNSSSQNNMKQLGIIVKMFQNENRYMLTPPGWHTVYPEYMTDPAILTAPWDEPGTASYQLIFPAASEDDLAALAIQISAERGVDIDDGRATAHVPLVYEVQGNPGLGDGRNVLFLDGHVEYIDDTEWRERIQPYLGR
jgi:prepilin-type processing-associated H-X9-DG protein